MPIVILCVFGIIVGRVPKPLKTKRLLSIESFFVGLRYSVVIDDAQASYVISNCTLTEYLIFVSLRPKNKTATVQMIPGKAVSEMLYSNVS